MTTESDDEILDSLFHGCALAAYVDQAVEQQGIPDSVATRQRAYAYYEEALAEKNRRKADDYCRAAARHASEADALDFIEDAADIGEEP